MDTLIGFASVVIITLIALFAALGLELVLLKATFFLMQPATADRRMPRMPIEQGTQLLVRAYVRGK